MKMEKLDMNAMLYLVKDVRASARPPRINGRAVAHQKLNARQRASLAAQVLLREKALDPSVRQIAEIFDVSVPYLMIAMGLSPTKREAIASGQDSTSFSGLTPFAKARPVSVKAARHA
jgi:hypothetical protein